MVTRPRRRLSQRRPFLWRRRFASHTFWYGCETRTLRRGPVSDSFWHGFDWQSFNIHFCLRLQSHTCFPFSDGSKGLRLNKFTIRVRESNLTIHIRIRERTVTTSTTGGKASRHREKHKEFPTRSTSETGQRNSNTLVEKRSGQIRSL